MVKSSDKRTQKKKPPAPKAKAAVRPTGQSSPKTAIPPERPLSVRLAKLTRPRASGVLARDRLFGLLDEAAHASLCWISAPAGAGKTTLVSGYIEARKLPCVWYQVDAGDADPATFFFFLGLAGKEAAPRRTRPLPLFTTEYAHGLSEFSRNFFSDFFSRLKPGTLLVFDDCQDLLESVTVNSILLEALSRRPEGIRILILSRRTPPPVFSRLRANRDLFQIDWSDLRLTLEEFRTIMKGAGYSNLPKGALQFMYERLDGWVAGLHLLLETRGVRGTDPRALPTEDPDAIFAYFAREIFEELPQAIQDFLLQAALLPTMNDDMARMLTGNPDASLILARMSEGNHFTERRSGSPTVYRFHPMFREFLLRQSEERYSDVELRRLKRLAATFLMDAGQTDEAARLLHEIGDWAGLQILIIRHASNFVTQGRTQSLLQWIDALPEKTVQLSAWILYWKGVCLAPDRPSQADACFFRAFHLFSSRHDSNEGLFLSWIGAVENILHGWHDFNGLDEWVTWMERYVKDGGLFPDSATEARVTTAMTAAVMVRQPADVDREFWKEKLLMIGRSIPDPNLRAQALGVLLNDCIWFGDYVQFAALADELRTTVSKEGVSPSTAMMWRWLDAGLLLWGNAFSPGQALGKVLDGLREAERSGVHVWDHMFLAIGVQAALAEGDVERAESFAERMGRFLNEFRRHGYCQYHYLLGLIHLVRGDWVSAGQHAEAALNIAEQTGYFFPILLCLHLRGQALVELGDLNLARPHLVRAHREAVETGSLALQYSLLLALGRLCFREGRREEGRRCLEEALELSRQNGYVVPLWWWHSQSSVEVFREALEAGIDRDRVSSIIASSRLVPDDPGLCPEAWPWAVRIYTLGHFALVCEGQESRSSGKAKQKPLEMLRVLIALGGRNVAAHTLADALWPDADGDTQHQSFTITLHRLRQMLGSNDTLEFTESRLSVDPRCCWVDAWSFERYWNEAESLWDKTPERAYVQASRACDLYKGGFLIEQSDERWAIRIRERLKDRFLVLIRRIGSHLEEKSRCDEAIRYYRRALDVDPLIEEFYQRLIHCYLGMALESEAVNTYRTCSHVLERMLGVRPSPRTVALIRDILPAGKL